MQPSASARFDVAPVLVVSPVIVSEPRAAPVPSAVAGVVTIDELFRLLVRTASIPSSVAGVVAIYELFRLLVIATPTPVFIVGERNGGQRQIYGYDQGG